MASVNIPLATLNHGAAKKFCLSFLGITLMLLTLPLLLARTRFYTRLSGYFFDSVIDYPFTLHNADFEVVVYGDSAGLFGVDPRIVSQRLGRPVVNLCRTVGILTMTGDYTLDAYLAHNSKPKAIVLYLAPRDTSIPQTRSLLGYYEGAMMIYRHGSLEDISKLFASSPSSDLDFWSQVVQFSSIKSDLVVHKGAARVQEVRESRGHISYPMNNALSDGCVINSRVNGIFNHSYVDHFVRKYTALGIDVVTFIAPVPDCDRSLSYYQSALQHIADNRISSLPHQLIADDATYVHPLAAAVPGISAAVAKTLTERFPHLAAARQFSVSTD